MERPIARVGFGTVRYGYQVKICWSGAAKMADEPPPLDFDEQNGGAEEESSEPAEVLKPEEKEESPPLEQAASQAEEAKTNGDTEPREVPLNVPEPEPQKEEPPESPQTTAVAPPPTLEARAADEGDEVESEVRKPLPASQQQPARGLDLFEEDELPRAQPTEPQVSLLSRYRAP